MNLFEIGSDPKDWSVDTFHFEQISVEFDPFEKIDPLEKIKASFSNLHPKAKILLTCKGFINGKEIQLTEEKLVSRIRELISKRSVEHLTCEFKDIGWILEDSIFKRFNETLNQHNYEDKKKELRDLVIKAMIKAIK